VVREEVLPIPWAGKAPVMVEEEAQTRCIQAREEKVQPILMDQEKTPMSPEKIPMIHTLPERIQWTHMGREKPHMSQIGQAQEEEGELMA
jgi:hypothetical protein